MARMRAEASRLAYRPTISVLVPVHNPERAWLERALDSVMGQAYPYWELCVCDDGSTEEHVGEVLGLYERLDSRIRVKRLGENVGIARATNGAFALAGGEFVGLLDHDDELAPDALFEVARLLQEHPGADLVYSDEDKIDEAGNRLQPHFKPGWSPDLAISANYLNHFSVYRRTIVEDLGGWREGFDGAQDMDLMQRFSYRTNNIHRIPKVLYHWRIATGSTAAGAQSKTYTHERGRRAVQDSLKLRGIAGSVKDGFAPNTFRIEREIAGEPSVSVLVPVVGGTPGHVEGLRELTSYPNYEVATVDVGGAVAEQPKTKGAIGPGRPKGSSLSELCNAAVLRAAGEYVLLLDPDLEAISEGWLEALLRHAQRPEVGAVGGKLLLPPGRTFQAGLVLGDGPGEEAVEVAPRFYRGCNRGTVSRRHFLDLTHNCSAVSSICMMFRKETFEEIGGFDTGHFSAEFADVDMCLRMREGGKLMVCTPYAEFTYHGPLHRYPALGPEEVGYVRRRWGTVLDNDPYYNPNLSWHPDDLYRAVSGRLSEWMGCGYSTSPVTHAAPGSPHREAHPR